MVPARDGAFIAANSIVTHEPEFAFAIDLPVRSEWRNIDVLRTSVQGCMRAMIADAEACERLAMITSELLENAVKYGDWKSHELPLRLHIAGHGPTIRISVWSPVTRDSPRLDELFTTLAWLKGFASPAEAYQTRMLALAEGSAEKMGSKLGLLRIAYEGNCRLEAHVENDFVRVVGVFQTRA